MLRNVVLVSTEDVAYSDTGADVALPENDYTDEDGIVTPPVETTGLIFMFRLKTAAILYLRRLGANGAANNGTAFPADKWQSFATAWTPARPFSVRWSATQANLYDFAIIAIRGVS